MADSQNTNGNEAGAVKREDFEKTKNAFMRAVGHNLRSPLTAVQSCLRVLATGAVTDAEDVKKLVNNALVRGEDALAMIDDLLALLEVRTNSAPESSEVNIENAVRAAAGRYKAQAAEKNIAIDVATSSDQGTIYTYNKYFDLMLKNLIDNAVKYSDNGNRVLIETVREEGEIKIKITSRGLLIGGADAENIFIEFWRAPDAKKYSDHGTGLGLPLAKSIADRIGGRITAAGGAESGTTFTVAIPVK
jgi:signal transduction histidine kinase